VIETLTSIAKSIGKEPAQVALRWLLQKPSVPSVVIGARTLEQLKVNLGTVLFTLTSDEMLKLNAASEIGAPYPYNLELKYGATRNR
jgi:aryl-alcohol dehydrogenase-like predicted oxidoreductase